jgi:hypothetical protein
LHAAALVASEPWAKNSRGQTMAVGAITVCLKQYGETTPIRLFEV